MAENDEDKAEAPKYGVCANLKQVLWLIERERIDRKMCGVDLDAWVALKALTSFQHKAIPKEGLLPAVPATGTLEQRALDKVITYMTGKMYVQYSTAGQKAYNYFDVILIP